MESMHLSFENKPNILIVVSEQVSIVERGLVPKYAIACKPSARSLLLSCITSCRYIGLWVCCCSVTFVGILNFVRATHVPVGEDQLQHVEFARKCANSFNSLYGPVLAEPKTVLCGSEESFLMLALLIQKSSYKTSHVVKRAFVEDVQIPRRSTF